MKKENLVEKKIETIAESIDAEIDYTTLMEELLQYARNPINLNTASREELEQLNLLTHFQISNLMDHISKNGKLINLMELQTVNGFDLQVIYSILPYVKASEDINKQRFKIADMVKYGKNFVVTRYQAVFEEQKGFSPIDPAEYAANPNSRYLGSPYRLFARYRYTYLNNISFGVTGDKDAGEEFFKGSQKRGFDFYSYHLFLRNYGIVKALALGDYQLQIGQGLTFWSGLAFGKTADATTVKRNPVGLKAYTSVNENMFLRGAAATVKVWKTEVTGFVSAKRLDANVAELDSSLSEALSVSSFLQSGFHTTPNELADRKMLKELLFGGNVAYKSRKLKIGFTAVSYNYGASVEKTDKLYNLFEFSGKRTWNMGIDYNYVYRNFNFYGEVSRSENGGLASVNGVLASVDPRVTFVLMNRYFQPEFQSIYGNAITESSRASNEKATYTGVLLKFSKAWSANAYYDVFSFPWLKYLVDGPSRGTDFLGQLNFIPNKELDAYLRIRLRNKEKNTSQDVVGIRHFDETDQTNLRFNITYKISPSFRMRNRVEYVIYQRGSQAKEKGYLIYQDITFQPKGSPISASFRYSLFDTDGYNSRVYAFENDVLYSFSIPANQYKGTRYYLNLHYKFKRSIDVWLRFAQTYYSNRSVISSGLSEIQGNTKSDIRVQVRYSF